MISTGMQSRRRGRSGIFVAAATTVAAVLAVSACSIGSGPSSGQGSSGAGTNPGARGSTWADIQARGVINIGVGLTTPPFGLTDKDGKPGGLDIEVAKQLASYLGVEANLFEITADSRIPTLQSGKADVISFTLTITPERQQQIDFGSPIMNIYQGAVVPEDSPITSVEELADKTIAVQKGTTGATYAAKEFPNATLQQYDTEVATFQATEQGQADAMVDLVQALEFHLTSDTNLKLVPGQVGPIQGYSFGIQKGNTTLLDKVNEFLEEFHAKGEGKRLFKESLGIDPPPAAFEGLED
ncbi:amino acid ABC transporter substrate-binding protein [Mycobacterium sp. NPDC003449]